ncbi:transketolase [Rhodocaloribacter sp.]
MELLASPTAPSTEAALPPLDVPLVRSLAGVLRGLAIDAVEQAGSGHPGLPMGMADVAAVLWARRLRHDPRDPQWPDRDRFVLSAGHGSMLLYALLHLTGYDLPMEELMRFRQWGSKTPGHPEYGHTPGVETTTGPLGQGFANGVGMAMAERLLAERFNRDGFPLVDHHTYVLASDGDLMEGLSHEAASLAGHLGLGKLIVLYDDNGISIDGPTALSFTEDVPKRFEAYGWHTMRVDGHDPEAVDAALEAAKAVTDRPTLLACRTVIGFGSPNKAGSASVHGAPLGPDELRRAKEALGLPVEPPFFVPDDVRAFTEKAVRDGAERRTAWTRLRDAYAEAFPDEARAFDAFLGGALPEGWEASLPTFAPGERLATRAASGKVLDALAPAVPHLLGGSADLSGSNKTRPAGASFLTRDDFSGRYVHYGVREHAMGAIMNGIALHGGFLPFGGTFLVFSDYMRPAVRMAALMGLPVIFVFTHDSIGLGEDGPTHQPVEHLSSLRAIPGLVTIRPADANETAEAWRAALRRTDGPTALVLTRQKLPVLDRSAAACTPDCLERGAYILRDAAVPQVLLMASGSEVPIALEAAERLARRRVRARVVSAPSLDLFDAQPAAYRAYVLPPDVRARVAVEAGATQSWRRYTGDYGEVVGLDRFGASAPYETLYERLGLTPEAVVEAALRSLAHAPAA